MSNAIKEISDANIAYAATFDDDKKTLGYLLSDDLPY